MTLSYCPRCGVGLRFGGVLLHRLRRRRCERLRDERIAQLVRAPCRSVDRRHPAYGDPVDVAQAYARETRRRWWPW